MQTSSDSSPNCCAKGKPTYKNAMNWNRFALVLIAMGLVGCGVGRVITAPVRYVFGEPEPTPAPNTSDVTAPGHPVVVPSPTPKSRAVSRKSGSTTGTSRTAKSSPSPQKTAAAQFPVAKPVPGRPGLVLNPFNPSGGYIDVSGYAPGSKVKDPDSQKIFIVP